MSKRERQGGTTALVITLTVILVFVGICFFAWMKIIGGGKELQHATDAGNLNVAKSALKSPGYSLAGASETNEFGDLVDPSNGQVDLLSYDRLVGKALLVSLNAKAEATTEAATNASTVLDMVEGSNGIGKRLADQLSQHSQLSGFFSDIAGSNSTRMLSNNGSVQAESSETAVAYMAKARASNVYITPNQLPPQVQGFITNSNNVVSKGGKQYIVGYQGLDTGIGALSPQFVPMRPGEQPHLVDLNDFQNALQSPLGGNGSSLIPPNAFRSGGTGLESNATNQNLTMRSAAIIGTLQQDFPISIPRGYIIVDNTGSLDFSGQTGGAQTALATALMQPSYIGLTTAPFGDVFGKPNTVEGIVNFVNQHASDPSPPPVPASLLGAVDSPSNLTSSQAYQMKGLPVHNCNNTNVITGGPGPHDSTCENKYNEFLTFYGSKVAPTQTDANGIMAVEAFKCYILQVRSSVGQSGCGSAVAPQACTGLKQYDINGSYCLPCNFAAPGNLNQLLTEAPGASSVSSELTTRMYQIKPTATEDEIASVLNTPVAFGQVSYIFQQGLGGNLVLASTPPSFPINGSAKPDGKLVTFDTGPVNLNGKIVNVPNCEGYPNPWDCPAVPAHGQNKILWTPSSGFNNLLGLIRFMNCAGGGGDWCCPC